MVRRAMNSQPVKGLHMDVMSIRHRDESNRWRLASGTDTQTSSMM
jgi:hypothetical protein